MSGPVMVRTHRSAFASEIRDGLTRAGQKILPSKYLYDRVGSALFEVICELSEYGLTRADARILKTNADDIVARLSHPLTVAEMGSGSGRKTRWLLEAIARKHPTTYYPIDISQRALGYCVAELGSLDGITFRPIEGEYFKGLEAVNQSRPAGQPMLVLFLGSTIGNFDRPVGMRFLERLRGILKVGDALLLGTDLVKPRQQLIDAYDDHAGVTAAFNRNVLLRINRVLDADFDLTQFAHEVRYNESERRIEMHLRSRCAQTVRIEHADLVVELREGETIWTESSHKFSPQEPITMGEKAGFQSAGQWRDQEWPFAETLLIAR